MKAEVGANNSKRVRGLLQIPNEATYVIRTLQESGYEAYLVGGCVRDMALGKKPHDWDVATNALPNQVMQTFAGKSAVAVKPTGLQHGTVTICKYGHNSGIEVTTYRIDGAYTDHRRPDSVQFTSSLINDLARRDFTINAMAMDLNGNVIDPFNGYEDIKRKLIRCVGNPNSRFNEDALRIMRAFRFASVLHYKIEENTARSMIMNRGTLSYIAVERIQVELSKALCGKSAPLFRQFYPVISVFWPEISRMVGFKQYNPNHCYDVFEHTLHALDSIEEGNLILSLSALLHDIGKPDTFSMGDDGIGHFYKHHMKGMDIAHNMLTRLKFGHDIINRVCNLIQYHDSELNHKKTIKRMLNKLGEEDFRLLLKLKHADICGQDKSVAYRHKSLDEALIKLEEIKRDNDVITIRDLAINGYDLINLGIEPYKRGKILNYLLESVIDGRLNNNREELINGIQSYNGNNASKTDHIT